MNIGQFLKSRGTAPVVIGPDATIAEAARALAARRKGLALVCGGGGELVGVVSVIDINRAVADYAERAPAMAVETIMTKDFCCCQLGDSVEDALSMMTERRIRHLPVVEEGVLKGLLNLRSILEYRFEDADIQAREMRGYIFGAGYH